MAKAHWALVQDSKAGEVRVEVLKAPEAQSEDTTVVQIVHPDMAFLVDSVSIAVNQSGRTVHWIVHPLMRVTRDDAGKIAHVDSAARSVQPGNNGSVVSCMLVECTRLASDPDGEALCRAIESTLLDVRCAVQDWRAMLSRVQLLSAGFTALEGAEAAEAKAFLNWLEQGHFTFLGALDFVVEGDHLSKVPGTALGVLKNPGFQELPEQNAAPFMSDPRWLFCAKATRRSSVHRPTWLDTISVKRLDASGAVVGESRFLGLYTSAAYAALVESIPVVRQHVAHVTAQAGVVRGSHAHKALQAILETYPRDEILQIDEATLAQHAIGILRLQERQRVRLFLRRGPFGRVASVLVYVPRDLYTTELRVKLGQMFKQAFAAETVEFTPMLTDSALARIHYIVRSQDRLKDQVDMVELEAQVAQACKRWEDGVQAALDGAWGGQGAPAQRHCVGFPVGVPRGFQRPKWPPKMRPCCRA